MKLLNTLFTKTKPLNINTNNTIFNSNLKPKIHAQKSISNQKND